MCLRGVDALVFLQVFDIEDMKVSKFEGDRIVLSSLYKCDVLLPLPCRDRKEVFGLCLKAGGPCAYGTGVWKGKLLPMLVSYDPN